MTATNATKTALGVETLEAREVPAVLSAYLSYYGVNRALTVTTSGATNVSFDRTGDFTLLQGDTGGAVFRFPTTSYDVIVVYGSNDADRIVNNVSTKPIVAYGYGGDDYLEGYSQADTFYGGDGNDTLVGYDGDDVLYGEGGNDTIRGMGGRDLVTGGLGNDNLNGGADDDRVGAYWYLNYFFDDPGNDVIYGGDGSDSGNGGSGSDYMYMGGGDDFAFGGTGNDMIYGDAGYDTVYGGDGDDWVFGSDGYTWEWYNLVDGQAGLDYQDYGNGTSSFG